MKFILRKKDLILKKNQFIRKLFLKCYNEKRAIEWRLSILHILYTNAQKFLVSQPFNSFAPVRDESLVKWFVDGSDYMEAVADSIDQAKQGDRLGICVTNFDAKLIERGIAGINLYKKNNS